jgi:hypothetical protein
VWKKSGKLLIEKKKRECGPKLRLRGSFGTNLGPKRGRVIHRRERKWCFCGDFPSKVEIGTDSMAAAELQ